MVWLTLLETLGLLVLFLFASVFLFYVPGFSLASRIARKLRNDEKVVLSYGIGLVLFLLAGIVLGLAGVRFLLVPVLIGANLLVLKRFGKKLIAPLPALARQKKLIGLLLAGVLVQGFINFPSGFRYPSGDYYWSAQGHDGLWHVAVIEALQQKFPPDNLMFAGKTLYNYHYFGDIIMAETGRILPVFSNFDLYFRLFSFLLSALMGLAAYSFLTTWSGKKSVGVWGIFFTYFAGSLGWIVELAKGRHPFGGEATFWLSQTNSIIGNPPHAFCYFFLPVFFLALHYYLKKKSTESLAAAFLLGGFLVGFKVSAGAVLLCGLTAAIGFDWLFHRKLDLLPLTGLIGLSSLVIFRLIAHEGESFLMFHPWWFIRTTIVDPNRVGWMDLELRRQFYLDRGGWRSYVRIAQFEGLALIIFLFGNLGTRAIGFLHLSRDFLTKRVLRKPLEATLFFTMLAGFTIPLLFLQRGVVYNLIQFAQYFLLIFTFWAAVSTDAVFRSIRKKSSKVVFLIILVAVSVPTVIGNLVEFYGKNPLVVVSPAEIEALNFIKTNYPPSRIILTRPFNPYSHGLYDHQPWPIYAWVSTGYVSAYTGRPTYLADEGQMVIMDLKPENRLAAAARFFNPATAAEEKRLLLERENISLVYLHRDEVPEGFDQQANNFGLKNVFENDDAAVYEYQ